MPVLRNKGGEKMKKKWLCVLGLVVCLTMLLTISASASPLTEPVYNSYTYNYWGDEVMAPDSYVPVTSVRVENAGTDLVSTDVPLNEPTDLFVSPSNHIYIVDAKNNRILVFNEEYKLEQIITEFKSGSDVLTMAQPNGIFVDEDENMYIADYNNHRTIKVNKDLEIVTEYLQPTTDVEYSGIDFLPLHVVVDARNFVYVHCQGLYQGAVTYDKDGKFIGYFAGNAVTAGVTEALKMFWRNFMTEEQIAKMEKSIPAEFSNIDINKNGFIFTCTAGSSSNNVVKFDPTGEDIMKDNMLITESLATRYGDTRQRYYMSVMIKTEIIDVCYDEEGYINCLDRTQGRVFQYSDTTGDLICIFGGKGNQTGTLRAAAAIDTMGDKILVLDSNKNHFVVYEPTPYVNAVKNAMNLYADGQFEESLASWKEVIKQNGNLQLAYSGMGSCYYVMGDYEQALKYYKMGDDRNGYIKAMEHTRKDAIDAAVPYIIYGGVGLFVVVKGFKLFKKLKAKKNKQA